MALRCALLGLITLLLVPPVEARPARTKKKQRSMPRVTLAMARVRRPHIKRARTPRRGHAGQRRRVKRDLWPPMSLLNANTREKLSIRLYDRRGRTIRSSVKKLRRFLRCHHTGRVGPIHWRLLQRVYVVARHFKGKTLRVYSGYRSRKVAYLKTSKHTLGRAIDFGVDGVSTRTLRDYLRKTFTKNRGLGFYPNTPFVHFDVRDRTAFWVDYSGKGEEPRYAKNPYDVLKQERLARQAKPGRGKKTPAADVFGPPAPPSAVLASAKPGDGPASAEVMGPPPPPPPSATLSAPVAGPKPVGPAPAPEAAGLSRAGPEQAVAKEPGPPVSNVRSAPP